MTDWDLIARYAAPIVALFVGAALNRALERRPKLVTYLAHSSAVTVRPPDGQSITVHSHSIVVWNGGRQPAKNVRIGHHVLPDFSVYPSVDYQVVELPGGGSDIMFPTLVSGEQITVTYLYFPPLLWSGVNAQTKSDEGFAQVVTMLPTRTFPAWLGRLAWALIFVGACAVMVLLVEAVGWVIARWPAAS